MTLALEIEKEKKKERDKAVIETLLSLLKKSRITEEEAAEEAGITVVELRELVDSMS